MADDPYAALGSPASTVQTNPSGDPYASLGSPADSSAAPPPVTYRGKNLKGEDITFQAPAGTDQATIKQMAIKAIGEPRYANATIFPPDNGVAPITAAPSDSSALNGFFEGAMKPVDNLSRAIHSIPYIGPALGSLDHLLGFQDGGEIANAGDAQRANNSRTGYQALGNIAGTAPVAAVAGPTTPGIILGGAATGAMLSDQRDASGVGVDAAKGAVFAHIGNKLVAPLAGKIASGVASGAKGAYNYLSGLGSEAGHAISTEVGAAEQGASQLSSRASQIILKALGDQGQTPQQAADLISAAHGRGVPLALMDTGDETRGLASALGRSPGEARTTIRDAVVPRQDSQIDRVSGAIVRDLGDTTNVRAQSEQLMQRAKSAAAPLYDRAYSQSVPSTPELESLLQTPAGRSAIARAHVIAANERRAPSELGFSLDADNQPVLNPAPNQQSADHAAALNALQQASDDHARAAATTGANMSGPIARLNTAQDTVARTQSTLARLIHRAARNELTGVV